MSRRRSNLRLAVDPIGAWDACLHMPGLVSAGTLESLRALIIRLSKAACFGLCMHVKSLALGCTDRPVRAAAALRGLLRCNSASLAPLGEVITPCLGAYYQSARSSADVAPAGSRAAQGATPCSAPAAADELNHHSMIRYHAGALTLFTAAT